MRTSHSVCMSVLTLMFAAVLSLGIGACSRQGEPEFIDDGSTDQMWSDQVKDAELPFVVYDGQPILIPVGEALNSSFGELEEGHFYRAVADVDYLYGGIAGYDGYPDVKHVSSVEEVSPDDLQIPGLDESSFGVVRLDGYAGGDFLLFEYGRMAVLKGQEWVWHYDEYRVRGDRTYVCYKNGVTEEAIEAGIAKGVYGCEDYFLVPAPGNATQNEEL